MEFSLQKFIQNAKVGTRHIIHNRHKNFENWFRNSWDNWCQSCHPSFQKLIFAITQRQKDSFYLKGCIFDPNYFSCIWIDFQNSCAYYVAYFLNFFKLLHFGWTLAQQMSKLKVNTDLWNTLYQRFFLSCSPGFSSRFAVRRMWRLIIFPKLYQCCP